MNPVQVEVRNVYGNELIYPANDTAKTFAALIGKKSGRAAAPAGRGTAGRDHFVFRSTSLKSWRPSGLTL